MAKNLVGTFVEKFPKPGIEKCREWNASSDIWLIRSSILFQLGYKENTSREWLEEFITPHLDKSEFFIRKAIGWALRQYSKYHPEWVIHFVENHEMSKLSKKEALKNL
jgi:3-methyladenine DNA glycosylase AlkD